ncbi:MAG: hypothetical protein ACYCVD_10815 [Desulfitobacteriaceae bacterium]
MADWAWPEEVPKELVFSAGERSIFDYVRLKAETRPGQTVMTFNGFKISYQVLNKMIDSFAAYLLTDLLLNRDPKTVPEGTVDFTQ